jgi:soluble lytic murein transglycosylase
MSGGPGVASEAWLARARRLMRLGDHAGARAAFREVDRKFFEQPGSDEAGFYGAWLSLPMGEFAEAVKSFQEFEERHPGSRKRDDARWFRAWALFRLERYGDARDVLLSLVTDFPRSQLVPQARYWATRAAQLKAEAALDVGPKDAGVKTDVAAEYRSIIRESPGAFYALLSEERLRDLSVEPPLPFPEKPKERTPKPPKALGLAVKLSEAGLLRDASEEIQRAVAGIGTQEDALAYGHALQGLGEYGAAYAVAARFLWGAAYTLKQPEAIALLYPRAYREPVEQACEQVKLDPYLAWAIMRRESAFRADVVSAADARGLMQIIPPTAKSIAEKLNEQPPAPDDLYSPSLNLRFGTWYLSALLDRLGHPALCAAGYNAGPNAVVKWADKKSERQLDEWIEEIPYKETRGYVKQVVGDYFLYQQFYGDGPIARLPLTLPTPKPTGVTF